MEVPPEFRRAALAAAEASGRVLRSRFRDPGSVSHKDAGSPIVTEADLAAERALREVLGELTPQAGIEGEELATARAEAPWRWVLDPIDGTIAFACGKPLFTTLIALLYEGRAVLGVIDQPITGERWVGCAGGTTLGDVRVQTRPEVPLAQVRAASTSPRQLGGVRGLADVLADRCHVVSWGGDAYNYAALASGQVDVVVEAGLERYDYAALVPIVEGAGGRITDWAGASLQPVTGPRDVLACSCPALHDTVLAWLATGG